MKTTKSVLNPPIQLLSLLKDLMGDANLMSP